MGDNEEEEVREVRRLVLEARLAVAERAWDAVDYCLGTAIKRLDELLE